MSPTTSRDVVPEPALPTLAAEAGPAGTVDADVVLIGLRPGDSGPVVAGGAADAELARCFGDGVGPAFAVVGATGAAGDLRLLPSPAGVRAPVVAAVGLGPETGDAGRDLDRIRTAVGGAARILAALNPHGTTVALAVGSDPLQVAAAAEGAALGAYRFDRLRTADDLPAGVTAVRVAAADRETVAAVDRAAVVVRFVAIARDLVNTPPSHLTPAVFATRAAALAEQAGCEAEVLDEVRLAEGGYGGILGVGQGSVNPPRLVRVSHVPDDAAGHVALVGKGITFDSGGLSIKPNAGMLTMKCDMAGAAAILSAVLVAAQLDLPVRVDAWCCLAENLPSGSAQRPSDVLTMRNGTTCEVLNTDAEGRLVLADGLARAAEDRPGLVLDVATLTGACVTALGQRTFGVFSPDTDLARRVADAGEAVGEPGWPMPMLAEESAEKLKSEVADIAHWSKVAAGGSSSAATFLSRFVPDEIPWAHLDIAGPAFTDSASGHLTSGGTGVGVRALVEFLSRYARP